jgi:preprotein translocase subunit SecF
MIDFVGKKHWFFLASAIVIVVGIISLAIFGLRPGIDFTGGTGITVQFSPAVEQSQLRHEMAELGYSEATIQNAGGGTFIIHTANKDMVREEADELVVELGERLNSEADVKDFYLASHTVGGETARNAGIAVAVAAIAMMLYIAWAFRRMPRPFRWGTCAIVALIHDVLIVVGIFSILGQLTGAEVDAMFIVAVLTVVGYSINNTVVVFDRIRENVSKHISPDFGVIVNSSLTETLERSLNTSLTTLCVILALLLFGGATIHYFVLALFIGLLAGTYSSLCISPTLLVVWERGGWDQLFSWLPFVKRTA